MKLQFNDKVYGMDGVYWCMQFVWWCFQQADYNGPPVKTTLSEFIVNQIFPILTLAASRATPHI